jgi:membrane protease YdiL (CAAX protease family)
MSPRRAWAATAALSVFSFLALFHTHRVTGMSFWLPMAATSGGCALIGLFLFPESRRHIREDQCSALAGKLFWGILSAALLYLVFWIGNRGIRFLLPVAGEGVDRVSPVAGGAPRFVILAWIALVIGPAEEILWRGVLQEAGARVWGRWVGLALAGFLYAAVHVTSGNPVLVLAAAVCGTFWGLLYLWKRSMVLNIVSHVVWDLSVFLWFPFTAG